MHVVIDDVMTLCALAKSAIPGGQVAEDVRLLGQCVHDAHALCRNMEHCDARKALERLAAQAQSAQEWKEKAEALKRALADKSALASVLIKERDNLYFESERWRQKAAEYDRERNEANARAARLSAAGQVLSEHVDKTAGAPLGSFELARNALGGALANAPNTERADTAAPDDQRWREHAMMHPNGTCTCAGEGTCSWCDKASAQVPELTIRDEFAKAAMQGLLSSPNRHGMYQDTAERAYHMADAMVKARDAK